MVDKLKGAVGMGPTSTTGQVNSAVLCCTKHLGVALQPLHKYDCARALCITSAPPVMPALAH